MKTPNGDQDRWPNPAGPKSHRSVLAHGLLVDGDVTSSGPVDVQGKIIGSVRAPDIVVAVSGFVEGSVVAHELSVPGAVSGMISARNLQLALSAAVHADIRHEQIAIEAGAKLEGQLQSRV
jgi:cytoskeletal protein CcmA (bactofilin family)